LGITIGAVPLVHVEPTIGKRPIGLRERCSEVRHYGEGDPSTSAISRWRAIQQPTRTMQGSARVVPRLSGSKSPPSRKERRKGGATSGLWPFQRTFRDRASSPLSENQCDGMAVSIWSGCFRSRISVGRSLTSEFLYGWQQISLQIETQTIHHRGHRGAQRNPLCFSVWRWDWLACTSRQRGCRIC